jgi:hypothetical protein
MYLMTLKVAKDRHTLASGPNYAGIAHFGPVRANNAEVVVEAAPAGMAAGAEGAHPPLRWTMIPSAASAMSQRIIRYIVYLQ